MIKRITYSILILNLILFTGCGDSDSGGSDNQINSTPNVSNTTNNNDDSLLNNVTTNPAPAEAVSSVQSILSCFKVTTINNRFLLFEYQIINFLGDAKQVICSISDAYASYTRIRFHKYTSDLMCLLNYDVDTGSGGFWEFTSINEVRKFYYFDIGSPFHATTSTFAESDCFLY